MEKIKWSEKATNEQVHERLGEKRALLNNILRRRANWIDDILRRNCFLRGTIEGQMTEVNNNNNNNNNKKKNSSLMI